MVDESDGYLIYKEKRDSYLIADLDESDSYLIDVVNKCVECLVN